MWKGWTALNLHGRYVHLIALVDVIKQFLKFLLVPELSDVTCSVYKVIRAHKKDLFSSKKDG